MPRKNDPRFDQLDILHEDGPREPLVWLQVNEMELRLLACRFVGAALQRRARAGVARFDGALPVDYVEVEPEARR